MERSVKERLVGAAVLMAAAIILIPEMLSGRPKQEVVTEATKPRNESAIKTYTIDLSQSPGVTSAPDVLNDRAPPPEEVPPPAVASPEPAATLAAGEETQENPESAVPEVTAPAVQPEQAPEPQREPVTVAEPVRSEPAPRPAPRVEPPPPKPQAPRAAVAAPKAGAWAVQLGSFAKQATAERLANEWRGKGKDAFVMPVKSGGATLYRVRIGPLPDRAAADAALRTVRSSVPGATVVPQP